MAHVIVDRRKNDKGKSSDNRRRFVRRVKEQVREAIKDVIRKGNISDIATKKTKKITIPGKGLNKPTFGHDKGGVTDIVSPGNKEFSQGDRFKRPTGGGQGKGREASNEGEGEDNFSFSLTREEFLEFFFEDLELPDLALKQITKIEEFVMKRSGFSVDGPPSRLNIVRSMKMAKGRRSALRSPKKKDLKKLEKELALLQDAIPITDEQKEQFALRIVEITEQIRVLKKKIKAIPFLDDVDMRYNRWDKFPNPTTQAVMFGIMDVSGSMGEWEQEMAKRFFMLKLLFLNYNYERVDIVWIRHHTVAKEVSEEEFFHSHESGGTVVSPALELMAQIVKDRYPPTQWNIYACQISDGDNWREDNPVAVKLLNDTILKFTRFMAYIEIKDDARRNSDLWPHYTKVKEANKNMEMAVVTGPESIYPVFRSLFEKRK